MFYPGKPPDVEIPLGPYPVMVTQPSGRLVPVVQAYAFTKYLGKLDVTFDSNGEVVEASGNPILLDHKIQEDPEVLKDLKEWQKQLNESLSEVVGRTRVLLEGQCRFSECNFGNLMTDAYIYHVRFSNNRKIFSQTRRCIQAVSMIIFFLGCKESYGALLDSSCHCFAARRRNKSYNKCDRKQW